ncbi:MAG: hypothetical protein QOF73_2619, partial [Thermomicrobiales bacterium]|nr:hypothetical protein [Thermomicrobiales bacterium]
MRRTQTAIGVSGLLLLLGFGVAQAATDPMKKQPPTTAKASGTKCSKGATNCSKRSGESKTSKASKHDKGDKTTST